MIHTLGPRPIQCMVAERGLTNRANIPIDPAIVAATGHHFIANKKKIKNADARVLGDARRDAETGYYFWHNNHRLVVFF